MKINKVMRYRKTATMLILLIGTTIAQAQMVERHKTIVKSFKILPENNVQVSNKYGNIHIVTGVTDSVRFEIEIKVTDKQVEKTDKIISNIDVQFNYSPYYIIANTFFNDYKGSIWSNISDYASTAISGGNKIEINWVIYIPENCELKIENKFGNVYTTNHTGKFSLDLSNGDFQANNLNGDTKLKIEFGKTHLNNLTNANIDINYADLDLKKATKIDLISRSSDINIQSVGELELNSRRDKYIIDSINVLKGDVYFTSLKVRKIMKDMMLTVKYGDLSFDELSSELRYFNLTSSYADVFITMPTNFSANIDLGYRKTILAIPTIFKSLPLDLTNKDTQEYRLQGLIFDTESKNEIDFKLNCNLGTLSIRIR